MQIYLDYSATTPPRPEVIDILQTVMAQEWGNPSSLHQWGQRSATVIEQARFQVGDLLQAEPESIVFTSGGTEADNLAIFGIARQYSRPQHLITSQVEHAAIAQPVQQLEQEGWQVTRLPVDHQGRVNPEDLRRSLQTNTVLISIIFGQSEVGTIQPIAELGAIARAHNICFHTDAVQLAGRVSINVQQLPVDLLSLSSHKLYGPQGVGALYIRPGVELVPQLTGGGQEFKLRSGTQAVGAIAGFGVAAALAHQELALESARLASLRDRLFAQLIDIPELRPTGVAGPTLQTHPDWRLPHHLSFCWHPDSAYSHTGQTPNGRIEPMSGRTLVHHMNLAGIAISAGSACHSGKTVPSDVLLAMGYAPDVARTAIRLTLGRQTTPEDVDWTALVLHQILARLMPPRALSMV